MKDNKLQVPKIALTIYEKNGRRYQRRPSVRKMRKMLKTSLKSKFKNGITAKLRVIYGKAETVHGKIEIFDNQAEVQKLEELYSVFNAFIDKGLWLPINKASHVHK